MNSPKPTGTLPTPTAGELRLSVARMQRERIVMQREAAALRVCAANLQAQLSRAVARVAELEAMPAPSASLYTIGLLARVGVAVSRDVVDQWTPLQVADAEWWASCRHGWNTTGTDGGQILRPVWLPAVES